MSYDATVFNVVIASPSDVQFERNVAREVVHEWNASPTKRKTSPYPGSSRASAAEATGVGNALSLFQADAALRRR
jgi:hypothetical protein